MKFLQYTSTEKQGASTASPHDSSPTLPTFTLLLHLTTYVLTRYTGYTTLCSGHLWPNDVSFKVMNSQPDLTLSGFKPTYTGLHHYEGQETYEVEQNAHI